MARVSATFVLTALLGVSTYLGNKADASTSEMLWVAVLLVALVAAAAIGRWFVLAALAGPLIALVVLESQGFTGSDGVQPLGFIMLVVNVFWTFLAMLIGLGARQVLGAVGRRRASAES